jgi:hypothetical protein
VALKGFSVPHPCEERPCAGADESAFGLSATSVCGDNTKALRALKSRSVALVLER